MLERRGPAVPKIEPPASIRCAVRTTGGACEIGELDRCAPPLPRSRRISGGGRWRGVSHTELRLRTGIHPHPEKYIEKLWNFIDYPSRFREHFSWVRKQPQQELILH